MKKFWLTLCVIVLVSVAIYYYNNSKKADICVQNGVFDAQKCLEEVSVCSLDGEWEFYSNKLLEPNDLKNDASLKACYISVPSMWNQMEDTGNSLYGTYRLELTNLTPGESYGLVKKNIRSACKIYIDGALVLTDGTISTNEQDEVMGNMPVLVFFTAKSSTAEILIQVSNFEYYSGGIVESLRFGQIYNIHQEHDRNILFETSVFITLVVIGVIFIILVSSFTEFRKTEMAGNVLPVTILSFAIINGSLGERVIKLILPNINSELLIRVEYISISIFFISLFYAIDLMEKKILSRKITRILSSIYLILLVMAIFTPLKFEFLWMSFSICTGITLPLLFFYTFYRFIYNKDITLRTEEHILILSILYFVNAYNYGAIFFLIGYKNNMNLARVSSVLFALVWFFLIAYRTYMANIKLKETETELKGTNDELEVHQNQLIAAYEIMEMEVESRTQELQETNEKLQDEIIRRKNNEEEIERLAFFDQLTNIPNRRYFDEHIKKEIQNAERYHNTFSVLYMDLDGFKGVNDKYGHDAGDKLLQIIGEILTQVVREGDLVARLGGDEFVMYLSHLDDQEVITRICKDIIRTVTQEKIIYGNSVKVGISIGIVTYPFCGTEKEILVQKADTAMYEAKKSSTQKFVFAK